MREAHGGGWNSPSHDPKRELIEIVAAAADREDRRRESIFRDLVATYAREVESLESLLANGRPHEVTYGVVLGYAGALKILTRFDPIPDSLTEEADRAKTQADELEKVVLAKKLAMQLNSHP